MQSWTSFGPKKNLYHPVFNLFPLKYQFIVLRRHLDLVAGLELAFVQFHGQRVEVAFLYGALERARRITDFFCVLRP